VLDIDDARCNHEDHYKVFEFSIKIMYIFLFFILIKLNCIVIVCVCFLLFFITSLACWLLKQHALE